MADILTNLRELSVAFSLYFPSQKPELINPHLFVEACNKHIGNCKILVGNISSDSRKFQEAEMETINNGYKLAKRLRKTFGIPHSPAIEWVGNQKSDSPEDLIVNGLKLSLKESSYILENMGLYKLLNIISDSDQHQRGLHVFETFSKEQLSKWYETTRNLLISLGPKKFKDSPNGNTSEGELINDTLSLKHNTFQSKINNFSKSTYADFKRQTNSKNTKKVFSKWLKKNVESSPIYIKSKKECAQAAGDSIEKKYSKFIGTSNTKLLRLFRIHDYSYFYCKTTSSSIDIFRVPSLNQSLDEIVINKFSSSVRTSQLNIYTEVLNKKNNKTFTFRNEVRYSHGQLNGVPEAKLYCEKGSDLSVVYNSHT